MTVQTPSHPGIAAGTGTRVRGLKGFVVGFVALAAAATGIGIAMSGTDTAPPTTVIAPVSESNAEQRNAYNRLQQGKAGAAEQPEVVWYLPGKPGIK
jgi:hypothetical protein